MKRHGYDLILIYLVLSLVVIGWIMVLSASSVVAKEQFHDAFRFFKRHIIFSLIGILCMLGMMKIDYRRWYKLTYPILCVAILLLIVVLIPQLGLSLRVGLARRWIATPWFTFQPSEIAKLALCLFLAYALAKKGEGIREPWRGLLPVVVIAGIMVILVIVEPDVGTALLMGGLTVTMLFVGGARTLHLAVIPLFCLPPFYLFIKKYPYAIQRLLIHLNPWQDMQGLGFQIIQSFVALSCGGAWGVGLGDSKQKLFFLPAAHTDFILAIIGEEAGFIGILVIISLFVLFIWRGVRISLKAEDRYGVYLAMGITSLIALQVIINVGVVLGLLPPKGLTLPFVSYGGTSIVMNLAGTGILLAVSAHRGGE